MERAVGSGERGEGRRAGSAREMTRGTVLWAREHNARVADPLARAVRWRRVGPLLHSLDETARHVRDDRRPANEGADGHQVVNERVHPPIVKPTLRRRCGVRRGQCELVDGVKESRGEGEGASLGREGRAAGGDAQIVEPRVPKLVRAQPVKPAGLGPAHRRPDAPRMNSCAPRCASLHVVRSTPCEHDRPRYASMPMDASARARARASCSVLGPRAWARIRMQRIRPSSRCRAATHQHMCGKQCHILVRWR